jgi:hypothetical protein
VRVVTLTGTRHKPLDSNLKVRVWHSMDGLHCIGRFVPEMKPRTPEVREAGSLRAAAPQG